MLGDAPARPGNPYGEPGNRQLPRQTHQRILATFARGTLTVTPPTDLRRTRVSAQRPAPPARGEGPRARARTCASEYDALADRRAFGLNFERHTPEVVELPGRKVRKGDKVHVLPERGKNPTAENSRLWRVVAHRPRRRAADRGPRATGPRPVGRACRDQESPLADLVVVAEFRDPIYPGLVSTGKVERGGDKPFHTVINAENYHALQTLLFTHRGQVDCIYIDPPYNTGNEGWIYNDKYVAGDDHYKHSKWLAFMERRLLLAKELLKPTGVIIVAIGDDEHHRLAHADGPDLRCRRTSSQRLLGKAA